MEIRINMNQSCKKRKFKFALIVANFVGGAKLEHETICRCYNKI